MMKTVLLLCLCGALLVAAAPNPKMMGSHSRGKRQMPNPGDMMGAGGPGGMPGGGGGNPGNLAMQGLGNIPDPTAWIAKGQEIASQFARGRRQAPKQTPQQGPPPMPKGAPQSPAH